MTPSYYKICERERAFVAKMPLIDGISRNCVTCKHRDPFYSDCQNGNSPLFQDSQRAVGDNLVCRLWENKLLNGVLG